MSTREMLARELARELKQCHGLEIVVDVDEYGMVSLWWDGGGYVVGFFPDEILLVCACEENANVRLRYEDPDALDRLWVTLVGRSGAKTAGES